MREWGRIHASFYAFNNDIAIYSQANGNFIIDGFAKNNKQSKRNIFSSCTSDNEKNGKKIYTPKNGQSLGTFPFTFAFSCAERI